MTVRFLLYSLGTVNQAEFGKGCEKLGVFIPTQYNLQTIFQHYDLNGNGALDYQEFASGFLNQTPKPAPRQSRFELPQTTQQRSYSPAKGTSTLGYQ